MVKPSADSRGFSLVELTCAFVIVSVLGIGLVHSGHDHTAAFVQSQQSTVGLRLATAELERARSQSASLLPGDVTDAPTTPGVLPDLSVRRFVTRTATPTVLEVAVEVRWTPPRSTARQSAHIRLVTWIHQEETR